MSCLGGIGIVFGNITNSNVVELTETAASLGASILHPSELPRANYLVASNVLRLPDGSDPYLVALEANPALAVVSTEWLSQCKAEHRQVPAHAYLLGPFSGIKVSITNFGARERDTVVGQLKQGGANYSPELFRHTTHLVGNRSGGNKYTHAKDWGLLIVHHDWVLDCLKMGRRLDERLYNLDTYVPGGGAALAANLELQRQPSRTVSSTRGGVPAVSVSATGDMAGAPSASLPARQAATASIRGVVAPHPGDSAVGGSYIGGGGVLSRSGSGAGPHASGLVPHNLNDPSAAAAPAGKAGLPAGATALQAPTNQPDQFFLIPAVPPDDCYFLHWVRLWVVGCTSSEQSHVLAAVRESGATREAVLNVAVTHIVFGSVLTTGDLAEVRQHLAEHREQVKLARLSWLYECVNRRKYMEPEGPYAMTVAQLLLALGGVGTGTLAPAQANRGAGHRGREGSPPPLAPASSIGAVTVATVGGCGSRMVAPLDDYVPLDPEGNTRSMDCTGARSTGASGVFSSLWFSLVAVAGTEEEAAAAKLVRQGGGMIMSASTEKAVREPHKRYAVCPFSLPQTTVDRLCSARGRDRGLSEFERVPVEQRVTVPWLRACVARGELLPVKRETPLFRPLPHALPLPRFQGVTVAVSQYHMEQREVLQELISRLGGTYTEKLNKRCNYLVIQDASGDKFTHALKWGIPCVRADWVLESAYAGRPLDDQLPVFLPAGVTPAEMEERRAAVRRGGGGGGMLASQLGPTQLGPTQRPAGMLVTQVPATMPGKGAAGSTQFDADGRSTALPYGLPPHPPDRRGAPTSTQAGLMAPPASLPPRGPHQPMPQTSMPPPAPGGKDRGAGSSMPMPSAPAGNAKPPRSGLRPLIEAILEDDTAEGEASVSVAPPDPGMGRGYDRVSGGDARPYAPPPQATAQPPYSSDSVQPSAAGCSAAEQPSAQGDAGATAGPRGTAETSTSAAGEKAGPTATRPKGLLPPYLAPPAAGLPPPQAPQEPNTDAATGGLDGATAMLLQFLDNNRYMPDLACSQIDLPLLPPSEEPGATGPPPPGAPVTSVSSRDQCASAMSLKTTDEGPAAQPVGGRRSRKRAAAAAMEEAPVRAPKAPGLPGRRGRHDEDEEGFGIGMSQQVGYEVSALAPARTRSSTRGTRAAVAKENLIKAVQGNIR